MHLEELEAAWRDNPELATEVRSDMGKPAWQLFIQLLQAASYAKTGCSTMAPMITGHGDALAGKIFGYEACLANIHRFASHERPAVKSDPIPNMGITKPEQATE